MRVSVAGFLVKDEATRDQMDGVFQFTGRRLIGLENPLRVGLEINAHFSLGNDIAALRVVFKVVALDAIVAA